MLEINFKMNEEGSFVQINDNGLNQWKHISTEDLLKIILNSTVKYLEEKAETPLLPLDTIKYEEYEESDKYALYLFKPAHNRDIVFNDRHFKNVGIPATISKFTVQNKTLIRAAIVAVHSKNKILRPQTLIYLYPFYNANHHDGYICIGNNRITINEPWELHKATDFILSLPETNDHGTRNKSGLTGDSYFRALENKPFPDEWLVPTNYTLKEFLER